MTIKERFEKILNDLNSNAEIIEIFATGSQIFKNNPNDLDYVCICSGFEQGYYREFIREDLDYDLMIYDEQQVYKRLDFNDTTVPKLPKVHNYLFKFRNVIFGNWNLNWDIFKEKTNYIDLLKETYPQTIGKRKNRQRLTKHWVHYYIVLKIYENNSLEVSIEMLDDIEVLYNSTNGEAIPIIEWIEEQLGV